MLIASYGKALPMASYGKAGVLATFGVGGLLGLLLLVLVILAVIWFVRHL